MENKSLILDLGNYEMQLGIAGDDAPKFTEPTIYADSNDALLPNSVVIGLSDMARERFYGKKAMRFKNILNIHNMFEEKDFASLGNMLRQIFEDNYWDPADYGLIIVNSPRITGQVRQKLENLFFKTLNFPRITYIQSALCVLSALGMDTGMIVDIGHFNTTFEGVFKGFPNPESEFELPIGGYHLTQYLNDLVFSKIQYESTKPLYWVGEDIKRAVAFAVINPKEETQLIKQGKKEYDQSIELPDGTNLTINYERFNCIEPLFEPELAHIRSDNIIDFIERSIRTWDRQQIPELVQKIIICGNGGKISGLVEKVEAILRDHFPKTLSVKVLPITEQKKVFWIGASILYAKKKGQLEWIEKNI
jgi:actin-related protein